MHRHLLRQSEVALLAGADMADVVLIVRNELSISRG